MFDVFFRYNLLGSINGEYGSKEEQAHTQSLSGIDLNETIIEKESSASNLNLGVSMFEGKSKKKRRRANKKFNSAPKTFTSEPYFSTKSKFFGAYPGDAPPINVSDLVYVYMNIS